MPGWAHVRSNSLTLAISRRYKCQVRGSVPVEQLLGPPYTNSFSCWLIVILVIDIARLILAPGPAPLRQLPRRSARGPSPAAAAGIPLQRTPPLRPSLGAGVVRQGPHFTDAGRR